VRTPATQRGDYDRMQELEQLPRRLPGETPRLQRSKQVCRGPYGRSRQGEALEKHVKSVFGKLGLVRIDCFGSILRGV
jgi:hypothetical protein